MFLQIIKGYPSYDDKINDKRDITVSLSATEVGINSDSHLKSLTYVKTINDEVVNGEFTVSKFSPEIEKELENEDLNKIYKKLYIYSPLPSVPDDIDELFEFVNKQGEYSQNNVIKKESESEIADSDEKISSQQSSREDDSRYIDSKEETNEEGDIEGDRHVLKIYGDAEVIDNKKDLLLRSQSLNTSKHKTRTNSYSESESPFEKYISQEQNDQPNSKATTTVSPYVAPMLRKKSTKAKDSHVYSQTDDKVGEGIKYILLIRKS